MQDYANKLMFDIFLHIFRKYYVDIDDGTSEFKMGHEICKRIAALCMKYKTKASNFLIIDTPNELY